MMKFFRKYNKQLLGIFMSLLLLVWLGSDALVAWITPHPGRTMLATTNFGDISQADLQDAQHATGLIARLGVDWQRPHPFAPEPLEVMDWLLLEKEARRMGAKATISAVQASLSQGGLTEQKLQEFAVAQDVTTESIYQAMARHLLVRKVMNDLMSAGEPTETEVAVAARDELEKATIQAVTLKASQFKDDSLTFNDEEIKAHFEAHRDEPTGLGLAFGYKLPPRVKVEYLKIDLHKIAEGLSLAEQTLENRALKYWQENKNNPVFRRPPDPEPETPTTQDAAVSQPAEETPTSKPAKSPFYETFEESRDAAREAVRKDYASKAAKELAGTALSLMTEPWLGAAQGPDGYRTMPAAVNQGGYFADIASKLASSGRYDGAVSTAETDLFDASTAAQQPEIGMARTSGQPGSPRTTFNQLVFKVQGIAELPNDAKVDRSQYVALYQPFPTPLERDGNLYVIRVIEARAAQPPESLDEVRDKVVADLKFKHAFETAKKHADELLAQARSVGLQAAWDAATDLQAKAQGTKVLTPPPFPREGVRGPFSGLGAMPKGYISGIGTVDGVFMNAIFGLSETATTGSADHPVTRVEIAEGREPMAVVVQWMSTEPLRKDEYQKNRSQITQRLRMDRARRVAMEWLSPDRIHERVGFKPIL